jgi:hypothetical protein
MQSERDQSRGEEIDGELCNLVGKWLLSDHVVAATFNDVRFDTDERCKKRLRLRFGSSVSLLTICISQWTSDVLVAPL